jgi:hypothetical protein
MADILTQLQEAMDTVYSPHVSLTSSSAPGLTHHL